MSTKKVLLIVGLGVLLIVGLVGGGIAYLVYSIFAWTYPPVEATDKFLALLGTGQIHDAYVGTAAAWQARQDEKAFTAEVRRLGLTDYASSSWSNRSIVNLEATVEGTVTTRKGAVLPLTVKLVKEQETWKVLALESGAGVGGAGKQVPPDDELQSLVKTTLLDFNRAVQAKDFKPFHDKIAVLWQRQITPEQLRQTFQVFIDKQIDLSSIEPLTAVLDEPPRINEQGWLVVSGYYPTKPKRVFFKLKYAYEHPSWKLAGINVETKD
jgi:hypothetical protein